MIQKNKKQLILSSIIILLPIIIGLIMWNILPENMATHWGLNGEANGWSSRTFAIFAMPVILLIVHWICIFATSLDPKNKDQSNKVFGMLLWIIPMTSLITSGTVYAVALGNTISIDIVTRIVLGLVFVIFGNYMPKCKQNHTIGIRVTWTLRNEENWNKTHRFAGRLWVFGGVLLLATLFIPLEEIMYLFLAIILLLTFIPLLYSYTFYRKQLKAGTATKEETVATPLEKKINAVALAIGAVALIFAGIFLFTGNYKVIFDEASFRIEANYWDDLSVNYADVENIEYREQDNSGSRAFGYGSFDLMMGEFENDEFGAYTRYSHMGCDSCIVLTIKDKILVINGKNDENTKQIYDELTNRVTE